MHHANINKVMQAQPRIMSLHNPSGFRPQIQQAPWIKLCPSHARHSQPIFSIWKLKMTGTGTHWHILGRRAGCSACFKPGAHAVTRCVMSLTLVLSCALSALHAYQNIYIRLGVQSCYVRLRDGVDLACDVLLPSKRSESMKHTAVFFQTRYLMRAGFVSSC